MKELLQVCYLIRNPVVLHIAFVVQIPARPGLIKV